MHPANVCALRSFFFLLSFSRSAGAQLVHVSGIDVEYNVSYGIENHSCKFFSTKYDAQYSNMCRVPISKCRPQQKWMHATEFTSYRQWTKKNHVTRRFLSHTHTHQVADTALNNISKHTSNQKLLLSVPFSDKNNFTFIPFPLLSLESDFFLFSQWHNVCEGSIWHQCLLGARNKNHNNLCECHVKTKYQIEAEHSDDNKYELLLSIKVFMIIFRARAQIALNSA